MKQFLLKIKEIELTFHLGNNNRRVQYNDKDFDLLLIRFSVDGNDMLFAIKAIDLPDSEFIHLVFDPLTNQVSWYPNSIESYVRDLTGMF